MKLKEITQIIAIRLKEKVILSLARVEGYEKRGILPLVRTEELKNTGCYLINMSDLPKEFDMLSEDMFDILVEYIKLVRISIDYDRNTLMIILSWRDNDNKKESEKKELKDENNGLLLEIERLQSKNNELEELNKELNNILDKL